MTDIIDTPPDKKDKTEDLPVFEPILNPPPAIPSSPPSIEETIWVKPTFTNPTIEGMAGMNSANAFYNNLKKYYTAFTSGDTSDLDTCNLSFNGMLQEKLNYLAEKYVKLFSLGDYHNATHENQEKKANDVQYISRQMFIIILLPFCLYFTYNWFFVLCYTNKIDIPVDIITETPYYTFFVDKILNLEPNFVKPVLLYFFKFPLKVVLDIDYFLIKFLRDRINTYVPNDLYIFVFYLMFWILYSLDNKFCDYITGNDQDGTTGLDIDILGLNGENDLCGDELDNPYDKPTTSGEDPCAEYQQCNSMVFSYIQMLCIAAIFFYWIQSIFHTFSLTPSNVINLMRIAQTPFPFSIIIIIIIALIILLRIIANLWDYFVNLSVHTVIVYLFFYSCLVMLFKIGPVDLYSMTVAMDDFMTTGRTDGIKIVSVNENEFDRKIIDALRTFISKDKFSLLLLITLIIGFFKSFFHIQSYHLRICNALLYAGCIMFICSYKFYKENTGSRIKHAHQALPKLPEVIVEKK
jgi:hypothetical protein